LFVGATFLAGMLREAPVWFLLYWAVCAWLTVCSLLLALLDLLVVRAQARRARRELHHEIFGAEQDERKRP